MYDSFREQKTDDDNCPISLECLTTTDETHPRQNIFITTSEGLIAKAYNVLAFKDFIDYFDKHKKDTPIKIPHVNKVASYKIASAIRVRLKFHLDALNKFPNVTTKILKEESKKWVNQYLSSIRKGKEDLHLRLKIYYFCQPSDFGDYFLNSQKDSREIALKIFNDKNIKNGFIFRKSSIVDTVFIKNYTVSIIKDGTNYLHYPFRHRYGFGYYSITNAERYATVESTTNLFISPSFLDIFYYCGVDMKNIVKVV